MTRALVRCLCAAILVVGCASNSVRQPTVNPADAADAALLADFQRRVERYMERRSTAGESVLPLETTSDPSAIRAAQDALAARIRALRADARHGDILTAEIRSHFRQLLAPELRGEQGRDVRFRLQDDAPEPDAVPLEVNAAYPPGTPFPTTPAPVLQALPTLPRDLEYRIIGRDLVLLDQPANLIVDYMRNAIPPPARTASGAP